MKERVKEKERPVVQPFCLMGFLNSHEEMFPFLFLFYSFCPLSLTSLFIAFQNKKKTKKVNKMNLIPLVY